MKKILFLCILLATTGFSKKKLIADTETSYIRYRMEHPLHNWDAKSTAVKCIIVYNEKIEAVAASAAVRSFDSGNSNRDSHALEVLEALTHKNVTFSSTEISENNNDLNITGNLTFHGVTRAIVIPATRETTGNELRVKGKFEINMKDYNVTPPTLMGIKTREKINIDFLMVFNLN